MFWETSSGYNKSSSVYTTSICASTRTTNSYALSKETINLPLPSSRNPPSPLPLCSLPQVAAYERGVADRGRRAELEAAQLQDAAEKALEEVKQGARITIEEMVARHSEEVAAENK